MGSQRSTPPHTRYTTSSSRYGSGYSSADTGASSGPLNWWRGATRSTRIIVVAATVGVVLAAIGVVMGVTPSAGRHDVLWLAEKTTRSSGAVPAPLTSRAEELSAGEGTLTMYVVGARSQKVGEMNLEVLNSGSKEENPKRRAAVIAARLADLDAHAADSAVGASGFSLTSALRLMADAVQSTESNQIEVWFSTTLFTGSVPPLEIAQLTAVDPGQAATQLVKGSLGRIDLSGVRLHPVMLTPIGPEQRELTPASENWRADFIRALGEGLGAEVDEPVHDGTTAEPWPRSSDAPTIEPIVEQTPHFETPPGRPEEGIVRIDNVSFRPDTSDLLDPRRADSVLQEILVAYVAAGHRSTFQVTGYCAHFGDAAGARELSRKRAETIAEHLREQGVDAADIRADGRGFDELPDPTAPPTDAKQRVVVVHLTPRV